MPVDEAEKNESELEQAFQQLGIQHASNPEATELIGLLRAHVAAPIYK